MFSELEKLVPQSKPDLQIGRFSVWCSEVVHKDETFEYTVVRAYMLLKTLKIIAFSSSSEIKIFELKRLLHDLKEMYSNVGKEAIYDAPFEESEFGLRLKSDNLGHIKVKILYRAWHAGCGQLEFEENLDQSYLPSIISDIERIIEKYKNSS